jgi:hypothetical protein
MESHFRPNGRKPRAITELINRYRKEPFGHKQSGKFATRALRNRHDLDRNCFSRLAHFAALLSREMDEPPLRFIGSMAMILLFWSAMMMSFRKNLCKFCPKLAYYVNIIILLVAFLIIYIHNNLFNVFN